jgi:hypothetical protein
MSEVSLGKLRGLPINNNIVTVPSGHTLYAPGHVIQVVNVENITRSSQGFSAQTILNIAGMEATITPKSANSKIVIQARWFGEFNNQDRIYNSVFGISRNGVQVGRQTDVGGTIINGITAAAISYELSNTDSTPETASLFVSDLPNTTLPVTYRMTLLAGDAATLFTNRTVGWSGQATGYELGTSGIMLMEIAQ